MPLLEHLGRTVEEVARWCPHASDSASSPRSTDSCTVAVSDEAVAVLEGVRSSTEARAGRRLEPTAGEVSLASLNGRWPLYTAATASAGVRSALSVPVIDNEVTLGAVRVYAGIEGAFEECADEVARLVDGGEPAALLMDSAMTLTERRLAERSPLSLRAQGALNRAIGALTCTSTPT